MIFGMDIDNIKSLGGIFTATEIRQQPKLWLETYKIIEDNKSLIESFLSKNIKSNTRIILTGAGTSD